MAFEFERIIIFWINRLSFLTRKELQQHFAAHGEDVTPEEWALLLQLWLRDGQTAGELADNTIRDRSTVTRLLDGMVRKELVHREPGPKDRRKVCIWLSAKGKQMEDRLVPIARDFIADALSGIPEADVETSIRTLRKMQDNLIGSEENG